MEVICVKFSKLGEEVILSGSGMDTPLLIPQAAFPASGEILLDAHQKQMALAQHEENQMNRIAGDS